MNIFRIFIGFVLSPVFFLLVLISVLLRNIYLRNKAEKELMDKNEELMALYEEIAASDEELKENFHKLMDKQEELQKSEERYRLVAESTMDIIWEGDLVNKKRYFSEKLYEILGYKTWEMEDMDAWFSIIHPEDIEWVKKGIKQQVDEKVDLKTFEYRVRHKDGRYIWVRSNTKCEFDEKGNAVTVFGAFTDINELKIQQYKINKLAYYDSVTGLPNRARLRELVTKEIESCHMLNSKLALFFIDLDNFKTVNDSFGHEAGDKLLLEVGKRMEEIQGTNMTSFRLGGDEFVVLITSIEHREQVEAYSKELLRCLAVPIFIDGNMFRVTASIGAVFYPEDGLNYDELLKNADTAMYISKSSGKGTYTYYKKSMGDNAIEKIKLEANLHRALENNEFVLHYQPIVDVSDEKVKGFEALIRWAHPEHGLIFPNKFIGLAEENGMIVEIGKWVIKNACKYAKSIYDCGFTDFYVSVNVSTPQFLQKDFTEFILSTLENTGISPELLLIEITESVLMESYELVIEKLNKLKNNNIRIALDDFGCGYSSLTYLRKLPINILKIDKSFIADIKSEDDMESITGPIICLAKQLGLNVVGEGVETRKQLNYLKKHGCDMFQGYLISKPVPEEEIINLLK